MKNKNNMKVGMIALAAVLLLGVLNIAENYTVNAVWKAAGCNNNYAPAGHTAGDKVCGQGNDHGNGKYTGEDDKVNAGTAAVINPNILSAAEALAKLPKPQDD